jgi:hypothetical protein
MNLYKRLETEFNKESLDFDVHVTKSAVYWRHDSAFAAFLPKVKALELDFCRDGFDETVPAIRHMEMSAHRVSHYIVVTDDCDISRIMRWLRESYIITMKKDNK